MNTTNQNLKILIIDDEVIVREVLLAMLEVLGYSALLAENGLVGLELFKQEHSQIVFTDLLLPNMSGEEIIIQLRQLDQNVFIVAISGFALEEIGSDANLQKPFTQEQLQVVLDLAKQHFSQP